MTYSAQFAPQRQSATTADGPLLEVALAATRDEVRAAQRLRYRVFAQEMGARLPSAESGIDADRFDPYCEHLIVRRRDTAEVVGCYRILTDARADEAGGFYSQSEFDLTRVLPLPGRAIEVGRSCVHADYRNGATIALLWNGLARFIVENRIDYLIGCASIPLATGTLDAQLIYERLARSHLAPALFRTFPKVPLPRIQLTGITSTPKVPPLIQAYLRAGALIGGEPAWDPVFNVADLFLLLRTEAIASRYRRHFLKRA
jgi:putative hemolysin